MTIEENDGNEGFVRGNDRLAKALADPERRARVDVIRAQMRQSDRAHDDGSREDGEP